MNFNVGTDILYIPRIRKIIEENPNFVKKVYTKKEIEIASTIKDPINFYATRFAAKEAIIKACNKYEFSDIEILKCSNGEPIASILSDSNVSIKLSLSYDNDYAIAFCILFL